MLCLMGAIVQKSVDSWLTVLELWWSSDLILWSLFISRWSSSHRQSDWEAGSDRSQAEGSVRGSQEEERGTAGSVRQRHGRRRISLNLCSVERENGCRCKCLNFVFFLVFLVFWFLNVDTEGEDEEEAAGAVGIPTDKCILFLLLQSHEFFFFSFSF